MLGSYSSGSRRILGIVKHFPGALLSVARLAGYLQNPTMKLGIGFTCMRLELARPAKHANEKVNSRFSIGCGGVPVIRMHLANRKWSMRSHAELLSVLRKPLLQSKILRSMEYCKPIHGRLPKDNTIKG